MLLRADSLASTHAVAAVLAGLARPGDVIVLAGDMGAGKTAFAQGFGRALGVTMQLPEADRYTHSKPYIESQIAILMGGRVAEELFLRQMTSGASNDIERATDIAQHMVCEWGMSELGPLAYRKAGSAFESDRPHEISEATAQRVDEEIRRVVMTGYDRARGLIETNRDAVRLLAEELLQVESLEADEIRAILDKAARL